jgi:hypothetical protein
MTFKLFPDKKNHRFGIILFKLKEFLQSILLKKTVPSLTLQSSERNRNILLSYSRQSQFLAALFRVFSLL